MRITMKSFFLFALMTLSLNAFAQLDCYLEPNVLPAPPIQTLSNVVESCSVVPGEQYWMCKGITENNCGLVRNDTDYWKCKALTTRQCGLARNTADYNFCKGLTESNCGVIQSNTDYWMCRGIISDGCGVVPGQDYWLCRAISRSFP